MARKTVAKPKPFGSRVRAAAANGFHGIDDVIGFGSAVLQDFIEGEMPKKQATEVLDLFDRSILEPVKLGIELRMQAGIPIHALVGESVAPVHGQYMTGLQQKALAAGKLEPEVVRAIAKQMEAEATLLRAQADSRIAAAQEELYKTQKESVQ